MGTYPHYGYSCFLFRATRRTVSGACPTWVGHRLADWKNPAETVIMAEACYDDWPPTPGQGRTSLGLSRCSPSTAISGGNGYYNAFPHNDGRNIMLCDGHAKWYKRYGDSTLNFTTY